VRITNFFVLYIVLYCIVLHCIDGPVPVKLVCFVTKLL